MKQNTILPEGLSEETLGAYLEGTLDAGQEIEVEEMLDQWDELQGFVNELADDYVAGYGAVDPAGLPDEADFTLPYVSGLDDMVVIDDDDDGGYTVVEIDDWNPGGVTDMADAGHTEDIIYGDMTLGQSDDLGTMDDDGDPAPTWPYTESQNVDG